MQLIGMGTDEDIESVLLAILSVYCIVLGPIFTNPIMVVIGACISAYGIWMFRRRFRQLARQAKTHGYV